MFRKPVALLLAACLALLAAPIVIAAPSEEGETLGDSGLILPEKFDFTIDPYELNRRGQIFSEPIRVVNQSSETVEIRIENLVCQINDPEIELVDEVELLASGPKQLRLALRRTDRVLREEEESQDVEIRPRRRSVEREGRKTVPVYEITEEPGEPIQFTLGASEEAVFELEGDASLNPESPWEDDDISLKMSILYRWVIEEDAQEIPEDDFDSEIGMVEEEEPAPDDGNHSLVLLPAPEQDAPEEPAEPEPEPPVPEPEVAQPEPSEPEAEPTEPEISEPEASEPEPPVMEETEQNE